MPAEVTIAFSQYIADAAKTEQTMALAHQFGGDISVHLRDDFAPRIVLERDVWPKI